MRRRSFSWTKTYSRPKWRSWPKAWRPARTSCSRRSWSWSRQSKTWCTSSKTCRLIILSPSSYLAWATGSGVTRDSSAAWYYTPFTRTSRPPAALPMPLTPSSWDPTSLSWRESWATQISSRCVGIRLNHRTCRETLACIWSMCWRYRRGRGTSNWISLRTMSLTGGSGHCSRGKRTWYWILWNL